MNVIKLNIKGDITMKKIITVFLCGILSLSMIFALAACSGGTNGGNDESRATLILYQTMKSKF